MASAQSKKDNATHNFEHRSFDIAEEPLRMLLPICGFEELALVPLEEAVAPLVSLLPKVQDHAWIAQQNCEEPANGLTQNESAAIMLYTMDWEPHRECLYVALNTTLRDKKRTEKSLKPWFLYLKLALVGLAKLPSKRHFLYRGVKLDLSKQYPVGKKIVWWGFSSCTTHVNVIEQFLGDEGERTMFNIDCYSGKDVRNHSFFDTENEVLLPPGRYFEVASSLKAAPGFYIIQLIEIESPVSLLHTVSASAVPSPILTLPSIYQNSTLSDFIYACQSCSAIDLSKQSITDDDIQIVVQQALIGKQCSQLNLNQNYITDDGIVYLAKALQNNKV
jgi:hypothetical protein